MYKVIMVPTDGSGFDREAIRVECMCGALRGVDIIPQDGADWRSCL